MKISSKTETVYAKIGSHPAMVYSLVILALYLLYITFGFETTDTGFHLSKQWGMFHGLWKENCDAIAGTNMIGGLWLLIPGKPSLIWARLGFALLQVAIGFISIKILLLYFSRLKTVFVSLVVTISLSVWQYYHTINYDNLPLLFILISVCLFLKGNKDKRDVLFILSGLAAVISAFCKITYVPILIMPFSLLLQKNNKENIRIIKSYVLGATAGTFAIFVLLFVTGGLGGYANVFIEIINDFLKESPNKIGHTKDHSFEKLSYVYGNNLKEILIIYVKIFLTCVIYYVTNLRKFKNMPVTLFAFAAFTWLFYNFVFDKYPGYGIIAVSGVMATIFVLTSSRENVIKMSGIILIPPTVFIVSFIGTDLGMITGIRSGSGMLLLSSSLLLISENEIRFKQYHIKLRGLLFIMLLIFTIYFIQDDFRPYQDFKYGLLSESFSSPQLRGIKSNPDRVAVADSLLTYLNGIPDLKDRDIYFAKHSPMYYYLTGTRYRLDSPWDTLNKLQDIKADFEKRPPEMIVIPKGSHRNYMWPNDQKGWESEGGEIKAKPYYSFYDGFIKSNNYIEVYKNSFYTVYELIEPEILNEQ